MYKPFVFISHVAKDKDFAKRLVHALRQGGTEVWWAHDAFSGGAQWSQEIAKALDRTKVFVAIVSPHFLASQWGMFEIGVALGRKWQSSGSLVLPVLIHGVRSKDLPGPLKQIQVLDANRLGPKGISKKIQALIDEMGKTRGRLTSG